MAKQPTKLAPSRETIAGLRGKLMDEQNLTAHLMRAEAESKAQATRLRAQSGAAARIIMTVGCIDPHHGRMILIAVADILAANEEPTRFQFDDDVPF